MTRITINKMLETTDSNLRTLRKIAEDETAPMELRLTAYAALSKIFYRYPVNENPQDTERKIW